MTPTLEEARELFRIARERNGVLHVGHVERFNGAVQELRKIVANPILIESRRLGPVRAARPEGHRGHGPHDPRHRHRARPRGQRGRADHGGRGASVHSARSDVANVQILFESGAIATITASRATEEKIRTLAITQPDAYIVLDYTDQDIQIHRRAAPGVHAEPRVHPLPPGVLRRAPLRPQGQPAQARDPAHPDRRPRGAADRDGGAARGGRPPLARRGARDRAHDPRGSAAPRLAAPLSGMAEALGLIGGAGALPALMAREARRAGWRVVAFALDASGLSPPMRIVSCPVASAMWRPSSRRSARRGSVTWCSPAGSGRTCCSREPRWTPPRGTCLAQAKDWTDEGLLGAAVGAAESMGIEVLDQRRFLGPWLAPRGRIAGPPLDPALEADVTRGLALARDLAARGVGQTVVLRAGSVAAVEAMEGTDEAIRRGLALAGRGAVVVKASARGHDYRFDVPAVGPETVAAARRAARPRWRWKRSACSCSSASVSRRRRPGRGSALSGSRRAPSSD